MFWLIESSHKTGNWSGLSSIGSGRIISTIDVIRDDECDLEKGKTKEITYFLLAMSIIALVFLGFYMVPYDTKENSEKSSPIPFEPDLKACIDYKGQGDSALGSANKHKKEGNSVSAKTEYNKALTAYNLAKEKCEPGDEYVKIKIKETEQRLLSEN